MGEEKNLFFGEDDSSESCVIMLSLSLSIYIYIYVYSLQTSYVYMNIIAMDLSILGQSSAAAEEEETPSSRWIIPSPFSLLFA